MFLKKYISILEFVCYKFVEITEKNDPYKKFKQSKTLVLIYQLLAAWQANLSSIKMIWTNPSAVTNNRG